jgi:hypothetical protein
LTPPAALHRRRRSPARPGSDEDSGVAFALTKNRLVPNFDTALSVTGILADYLAGTR